jgi:hypothetical protein
VESHAPSLSNRRWRDSGAAGTDESPGPLWRIGALVVCRPQTRERPPR